MEYSEAAKFFLNSFLMFSRSTSLLETRTRMRVWSSVPAPFTKGKERGALSQPVGRGARLAWVRASEGSESSSADRTPKSVISRRTEPDVRMGGRGRACTCLHRVVERLCQVGRDAADGLH